jgi:hypothetical protein
LAANKCRWLQMEAKPADKCALTLTSNLLIFPLFLLLQLIGFITHGGSKLCNEVTLKPPRNFST